MMKERRYFCFGARGVKWNGGGGGLAGALARWWVTSGGGKGLFVYLEVVEYDGDFSASDR